MADKETRRQRVVPSIEQGTSRVSKAAVGNAKTVQSTRVEQRSQLSTTKQGSSRSSDRSKKGPRSGARKPKQQPYRTVPARAPHDPNDTKAIQWAYNKWNGMEAHHQQRIWSIVLLILSLLLFGSLTIFRTAPILSGIGKFFVIVFGWSAYLLALGLVAFALTHLIEGIRNQPVLRWSMVFGLGAIWLLLLIESRLLIGSNSTTTGVLAGLLVRPLLGWPAAAAHVMTLGLIVLLLIFTFRITFGHVLLLSQFVQRLISDEKRPSQGNKNGTAPTGPSPFLGQRPQFSRYGNGLVPAQNRQGQNRRQLPNDDVEEEEEGNIDFEADFDAEDDDPRNDINIHKRDVGLVPRGPRVPLPLNLDDHVNAVKGARQQPLPLDNHIDPDKLVVKDTGQMEDLMPNSSRLSSTPGVPKTSQRTPRLANPAPQEEGFWILPQTTLLNNPEEVKLQLLGDDTETLAKTIQETLRSFRVDAEVKKEDISIGPTIIRLGIRPTGKPEMKPDEKTGKPVPVRDAGGNIVYETRTRVSRIMALQNDLALVLEAKTIRMEAPVPGRPYVGVEIPNKNSRLVTLREVLESKEYQTAKAKSKLTVALGKDVAGVVRIGDLARMPHLLIAGATGAGKCLAYDEPVFLADGRVVKVQDLIGRSEQVIGITNTETMEQTPTLATFTENSVQEVFEIELDNGVILRRTGEHPLWAACLDENQYLGRQPDGKAMRRTRAVNSGWVHTKDLRTCGNRPNFDGHVVLCPLDLKQQGTISRSDADIIICAALLAEGGLSHDEYLTYMKTPRFTNADPTMVELVARAVKEYNCRLVVSPHKKKGLIDYYISQTTRKGRGSGNPVARLVYDWKIDCLATKKTVPAWVFQLPDEQIALFLHVFIDCDGWISVRGHRSSVNVSLANSVLVQQIGQLALRLGITGTYTHKENGHAGAWTWMTPMVQAWQERVGSLVKAEKLALAVTDQIKSREDATTVWNAWRRAHPLAHQNFSACPSGYEWRKIVSIRRVTAPTVNIEVHSENHAFVGYAVEHNSVCINTIIASIVTQATPDDVRLLMVDPKMVELNMYNGIPHLLSPVVTEVEKVVSLLKNGITEMEKRYRLFSQLGVRNLDGYRKMRAERAAKGDTSLVNLPAIVIIIDELADLMMAAPEEVEGMICRLAQLARATGIHLVVATQRPSVDVITGLIKANIPTRISFMVSSAVDSRTIIDMGGAERLLGRGDMLYLPSDAGRPERIQGSFLADEEAESLVQYWREQATQHAIAASGGQNVDPIVVQTHVEPGWELKEQDSEDFELDDDLLDKAEEVVREYEKASISLLQRRLRIGYSRAARLIDLLEERGIIGHSEHGGRAREIIGNGDGSYGEGHTMADEVSDIMAEEKARDDFLKKQAANGKILPPQQEEE
ncbi:MAG: hypothetical protein NVS4B11_09010 [Ktedonobacteraceae bacterium]